MKNLSIRRRAKKLSQLQLAEKIGVARSTLGMWELGKAEPDNTTIVKLAKILDCTSDYLLGITDEPNLVHYVAATDLEGNELIALDMVKDALNEGMPPDDIQKLIQMFLAWRNKEDTKEEE